MKTLGEIWGNLELPGDDCDFECVQALYNFYIVATVALHKENPTGDDFKALDEAGKVCEELIGKPEGV
jgi:hypothetical protein